MARNPLDHQAVGPLPLRHDPAQRIRQPGDRFESRSHGLDAALVEHEAVQHRGAESSLACLAHIDGVRIEDLGVARSQFSRGGVQRRIASVAARHRQLSCSVSGLSAEPVHCS